VENRTPPKFKIATLNTLFTVLFLVGLILTVMEIELYRDTFITPAIPTLIWLFPGLVAMPLLPQILERCINTSSTLLQAIYNFGTWGGFIAYAFMALNYYFTNGNVSTEKLVIQSTSYLAKGTHGCGNQVVTIRYEGVEKDLIFPCDVPIEKYKDVELKITNG
jgi:hypothetical protein